jgi:putative endopeptidase
VTKHLLAATLFLAACGSKSDSSKSNPPATGSGPTAQGSGTATPTPTPTPAPTKPEIGTWGFDTAGMKPTVAPGASFFQYANGTWLEQTQIPADKSNYGMFTALADRSEARTKEIILGAATAAGPDAKKIADYYQSFMDEAAIEAAGIAPIQPDLDRIAAIKDVAGLIAEFGDAARHFRRAPFGTLVAQDDKDPEHYIAVIGQGGLGLPDRDFYEPKAAQFAKVRDGYKQYLEQLLTMAGVKDAAPRAAAVYALEEKIAATHWTKVQNRDPQKTYNKMTLAELQKAAPGVDWAAWAASVGLAAAPAFNVNQPPAIAGIAKLVASQPVDVWKDYLTVHTISAAAPYLSKAFVDAQFTMYGKVLSGTPENKERWKRGVDGVTGAMGEAVGKLYVDEPETKAKAKAKLATYNPKIGYPNRWARLRPLEIKAGDPVGNVGARGAVRVRPQLAKLGKPVDRDEWGMTPQTVNAYYNPGLQRDRLPGGDPAAAVLRPDADAAVNYGGIGAVIGHEISHGFDDQGRKYDGDGNLRDWWTDGRRAKFKAATKQAGRAVQAYFRCPLPAASGAVRQRRADAGREHRRPGRPDRRLQTPTSCRSAASRRR